MSPLLPFHSIPSFLPSFLPFKMTSFLSTNNFIDTNIQCMEYDEYADFLQFVIDDDDDECYKVALNALEAQADKDAEFNIITYKFQYSISDGCEITISDVINAKGKTTREVMKLLAVSFTLNTAILGDTDPIYFHGINEDGVCEIET